MLENIRIILVNTSHPGNIGSTARAMKTMGLSELYLVSPKLFPHVTATELSAGAEDILEKATIVQSIPEAIKGCHCVIGTSARVREISLPIQNPRECGQQVMQMAMNNNPVAIIFGREQTGLTNDEILHCHQQVFIPTNPDYRALNLASAVQVICYEIRMALQEENPNFDRPECELAEAYEVELLYQQMEETLIQLDFLNPKNPRRLMPRLRRLFNRIHLEKMEVNILRGIIASIKNLTSKES